MPNFRFVALDSRVAQELRTAGRSHDLTSRRMIVEPDDRAPCRHCLKDALPGEEVILVSFSPFSGNNPYNERGPIFIHARDCSSPEPSAEIPEIVARRLVVIRAYSAQEEIIDAHLSEGHEAAALIERLLAPEEAAFLHVRTGRYGCYLARIDRSRPEPAPTIAKR